MANNPFETPASMSTPYQTPPSGGRAPTAAPGGVAVICIFCIILGALGLLSSCIGAIGTGFQSQIQEMQQNVGDPNQQAMQKKLAEIQNTYTIPNLVLILANFIVAPCLLAGGIGVLSRKMWGAKILNIGLLMAIGYVAIRTVIGMIMQFSMMGAFKDAVKQGAGNAQGAQAAESIMTGAFYAGIIFGVIWALILIGFYLWSWTYMNKEHVKSYCATFS